MIFIGFIIGFLGYLPPGNINLTVVQMSIGRSRGHVWHFILFAALMEFIYCFSSLMGMKVLLAQPQWIIALRWASVVVFTALGILTFFHKARSDAKPSSGLRRGMIIAVLNPLQIPFWLIWGVYAMQSGWVQPDYLSITLFSIITATGTIAILWLYSAAGRKLEAQLNARQRLLNLVIGSILIGLAVMQLVKLVGTKA